MRDYLFVTGWGVYIGTYHEAKSRSGESKLVQ